MYAPWQCLRISEKARELEFCCEMISRHCLLISPLHHKLFQHLRNLYCLKMDRTAVAQQTGGFVYGEESHLGRVLEYRFSHQERQKSFGRYFVLWFCWDIEPDSVTEFFPSSAAMRVSGNTQMICHFGWAHWNADTEIPPWMNNKGTGANQILM